MGWYGVWFTGFRVVGVLAPGCLVAGCTTTVVVPYVSTDRAETVYLIDYGRHSSLVLGPETGGAAARLERRETENISLSVLAVEENLSGHCVEYAYGEWWWYALCRDEWHDLFRTMLLPTQGALGRRDHGIEDMAGRLERQVLCEEMHAIVVDRIKVDALRDRLDARFALRADTKVDNTVYDMQFVHDDSLYTLAHNCNRVVADWLRELGCRVSGITIDARFRVEYEKRE